mgnify:CR=1 FL=1
MPTNKELQFEVNELKDRLARLQASNSRLRDEVAQLRSNYSNLVEGVNTRFEDFRANFLNK